MVIVESLWPEEFLEDFLLSDFGSEITYDGAQGSRQSIHRFSSTVGLVKKFSSRGYGVLI
jgi:hypothetical protein